MKKIAALLLAGALTAVALTSFASCKKKNQETNDDSQSYTENTEVVDYVLVESKSASGATQRDSQGNVIYDFFRFEAIDSTSTRLVSYSAQIVGTEGASMLETQTHHRVTIPATFGDRAVTEIGEGVFYANSSVSSIVFPDQLKTIGNYAFALCSELSELEIPGSITTIGEGAFCKCTALKKLQFAETSELTEIPKNAFLGCKELKSLTIPGYVKTIDNGAFYGAEKLQTLTISEGVEKLEKMAFFDTKGLAELTLPDSLTEIGELNFYGTEKLTANKFSASGNSVGMTYVMENLSLK